MPTPGNQVPPQFLSWNREAFEQKIQATHAAINNLQQTLFPLKEGLNATTPLLSLLPEEVLSDIFKLSIDEGIPFVYRPRQFHLGAVCRAWRRIIWSQSSFWKNLHLISNGATSLSLLRLQLVREWIDRSGGQLIQIRLQNQLGPEPLKLYELLFTISARWETLHIRGGPFRRFQDEILGRKLSFPILREVDLSSFSPDGTPKWAFKTAPLRTVTLHAYTKNLYDIEWSNLRDVTLHFRIDDALFVLNAASSSIQNATLFPFIESRDEIPLDAPYTLPRLTTLDITEGMDAEDEGDFDVVCVSSLLECLALPALQHLSIQTYSRQDGPDNYAPALISMIQRSRCRLKTLRLCLALDLALTEPLLIEILQEVPSLNELSLHFDMSTQTMISNATLDFLNPSLTSSGSLPLPNLLSFGYIGRGSFSFQNLESMLLSRLRHAKESELARGMSQNHGPDPDSRLTMAKIKKVDIEYYPSLTSEDPDSTDQLDGLQNLVGDMHAKLGPLFEEEGSNFTFSIAT